MGTAIEYQKVMNEIVYINLPGPVEPNPGMSGGELLHGFLAELHESDKLSNGANTEIKDFISFLCTKWNVRYREYRG